MPWFSSVPTGNNTLSAKLKNMYHDAGINGNKVNHGLHTTGTTDMVQAHVPEESIQERTGQRSLAALRTYERTTEEQHRVVPIILSSSSQRSYQQNIQNNQTKIDQNIKSNTSQVSGMHLYIQNMTGCTFNVYKHQFLFPLSCSNTNRHCVFTMWHLSLSENNLELLIRDLESH